MAAATAAIYTNSFETYSSVATSLADTADADPTGSEWTIVDDAALSPTTAGAGIQVINWLTNSAGAPNQCLLVRAATEAQVNLFGARSGSKYQLDFWALIARGATSDRSFYIILRGEGADHNGQDYIAYRTDRVTNSSALNLYDGVRATPNWVLIGAPHANNRWQHHRLVIDTRTQMVNVFVDDMVTPITSTGRVARSEVSVPTLMRIVNEANSADDGWFAIDDISLTVDDAVDLTTTFAEGFESYPARLSTDDDADPQGPWITVEVDGVADGGGRPAAPAKVQVVDASVVPPHSGNKCLKLEYGQRAGASIAWGVPPQADVQITWWARVPASVAGGTANYLRMSLYGVEDGSSFKGDCALLGYGSRQPGVGDATSLTFYVLGTAWLDSGVDYTPDTWEEYRLITHTVQGTYSIIKNPSSGSPQLIVDRGPLGMDTSPAPTSVGPYFMAAWSSSNGTNHPPVYIDDIEIKSLVTNPEPLGEPYTPTLLSTRFTNYTKLITGGNVGGVAVDPRDKTTILVALDAASGAGGIYRVSKIASGNWAVDPTPVVTNLSNPSGLTIAQDGTLWWIHDFTMALMRLRAPWSSNTPELVITNFGYSVGDDDPVDVTIAPANFNGSIGKPGMIVVADRGSDADPTNAVYVVDPATTALNQSYETNGVTPPAGWWQFLVPGTTNGMGLGNFNAIAALPASGEIVVASEDGWLTAIDGNGATRAIFTTTLWTTAPAPSAAAIAVDPTTGRLWVADDARDEIWSLDANNAGSDVKEISFPLTIASQTPRQMDFHDPGMAFAPDGSFLALTDTSTLNGGGRLIIFHNEPFSIPPFSITQSTRSAQGCRLAWQSAGAVKYRVQRATTVVKPADFVDITGDLTGTSFTDTNAPAGMSFYRVVARP